MNKAVYIGAGTDIIPVIVLDNITEYINEKNCITLNYHCSFGFV